MAKIHPYYQENYIYCPRCSAEFNSDEQPLHCDQCGFEVYANPAPSTAIFVIKNNKILLAKRNNDPKKGGWDTPGGFLEVNETIEASAIREMKEETGLDIEITEIIGSEPDLYVDIPILTIGVTAKIIGGTMQAADDVASLHWINLKEIPEEIAFSSVKKLLDKVLTSTNQ